MNIADSKQYSSAIFVGLLGTVFLTVNAGRLAELSGPTVDLALAGLGAVIALVLIAAAGLLLRFELAPEHALRVAGWAALGTAVLGLVLVLIALSESTLSPFAGATLLSVSTFAHVLIGVRDVQRIRVEDVERQREQLSVLNRLVRHNLRHVAQQLLFVQSRLPDAESERTRVNLAENIHDLATGLTDMNDQLSASQQLIEDERPRAQSADLSSAVESVVAEYQESHPVAEIRLTTGTDRAVVGGAYVRQALAELVENAVEHTGDTPSVTVETTDDGAFATVEVTDTGPGVPELEQSLISREERISQLNHSQGLGLWFVRWVADALDGDLDIETTGTGTTARLQIPYA
jgi:signal transduction histidine kinase